MPKFTVISYCTNTFYTVGQPRQRIVSKFFAHSSGDGSENPKAALARRRVCPRLPARPSLGPHGSSPAPAGRDRLLDRGTTVPLSPPQNSRGFQVLTATERATNRKRWRR